MTDRVRELNRKLADDIKALQNQYLIDSGEWKLNSTIIVKKDGKEYCRCKVTNILFRNESVTVTLNRIKPDGTLNYNQFDYYKYGYTFEEILP